MTRFIFRQFDHRDLDTFLDDRYLYAKNHLPRQECHQTSYPEIVERRGLNNYELPTGGVVNDYVPFYFCPITSFAYTINKGNVPVISPQGVNLGRSNWEDRLFVVYRVDDIVQSDAVWCFSNFALNSIAPTPTVIADISAIESHIDWSLFDENPIIARISEIGYPGCCRFFSQKSHPRYALRQLVRMAEFLIKDRVPLSLAAAIICPTEQRGNLVHATMKCHNYDMQIIVKPECFLR